jgi:drug/metabolite transporter (DMT)-like permease
MSRSIAFVTAAPYDGFARKNRGASAHQDPHDGCNVKRASILRLVGLAVLWGGSFLLMRMASPYLAPPLFVFVRVAIAALFLLAVVRKVSVTKEDVIVGALNSALPFMLLAFAARSLEAGTLSVLNATSPAFGAIVGAIVARALPPRTVMLGLVLGVAGVGVAVGKLSSVAPLAVASSLGAALCYGLAAVYTRTRMSSTRAPAQGALASMITAGAILALPAAATVPEVWPSAQTWIAVALLGVFATGLAYHVYFRLVADEGPVAALSVTFLVPLFAIAWSWLVLDERVTLRVVLGGALVLLGTGLSTGVIGPRRRT